MLPCAKLCMRWAPPRALLSSMTHGRQVHWCWVARPCTHLMPRQALARKGRHQLPLRTSQSPPEQWRRLQGTGMLWHVLGSAAPRCAGRAAVRPPTARCGGAACPPRHATPAQHAAPHASAPQPLMRTGAQAGAGAPPCGRAPRAARMTLHVRSCPPCPCPCAPCSVAMPPGLPLQPAPAAAAPCPQRTEQNQPGLAQVAFRPRNRRQGVPAARPRRRAHDGERPGLRHGQRPARLALHRDGCSSQQLCYTLLVRICLAYNNPACTRCGGIWFWSVFSFGTAVPRSSCSLFHPLHCRSLPPNAVVGQCCAVACRGRQAGPHAEEEP